MRNQYTYRYMPMSYEFECWFFFFCVFASIGKLLALNTQYSIHIKALHRSTETVAPLIWTPQSKRKRYKMYLNLPWIESDRLNECRNRIYLHWFSVDQINQLTFVKWTYTSTERWNSICDNRGPIYIHTNLIKLFVMFVPCSLTPHQ